MKHIVWAVMAAALIFTATAGYSRGFSVGVFGAYSIDGGAIEKTIDLTVNQPPLNNTSHDIVIIPGMGVFGSYDFGNIFFIRFSTEYHRLTSGEESKNKMSNMKYIFEYDAVTWPLIIGFNTSPDKGRTTIYIGAGIVPAMIHISCKEEYMNMNMKFSDNKTMVIGFTGLFGVEKKIIGKIGLFIEYAFSKCETNLKQSYDYYSYNGTSYEWQNESEYTERYGLPRQQARIGVKYSF